jgi:hypothetical protein
MEVNVTDAPECWNLPDDEPEVYWSATAHGYRPPVLSKRADIKLRPSNSMRWFCLTEQDAARWLEQKGLKLAKTVAMSRKQCTQDAEAEGREGVGIMTYEGDEKVCVRYWLIGDPVPGGNNA